MQNKTRSHQVTRLMVLTATITTMLGLATPATQVAQAHHVERGLNQALSACRLNGQLIRPKVDSGHTYGWVFLAKFDAASGGGNPISCLVTQTAPNGPEYDVRNHCTVMNNIGNPPTTFTGGLAQFDGNAYLSCNISVLPTQPEIFYLRGLVGFATSPAISSVFSHTLIAGDPPSASDPLSVVGQTNGCTLTLNSRYGTFSYGHTVGSVCGGFVEVGSRVRQNFATTPHTLLGQHMLSGTLYGPTTGYGQLQIPGPYTFTIGAPGQQFDMDWLLIDPTPAKSTGG